MQKKEEPKAVLTRSEAIQIMQMQANRILDSELRKKVQAYIESLNRPGTELR